MQTLEVKLISFAVWGIFLSWCLSHRVVDLPYCATYQKEKVNLSSQFVMAFHNCISVATNTDFREESIYNIIHDRDYTNAKSKRKKIRLLLRLFWYNIYRSK